MKTILCLVFLVPVHSACAGTTNKKPHVHGLAQVTLALESGKSGTIDLDVPAESIYGFEHEARTKADKAAQSRGLGLLRGHPEEIVKLPSGCSVRTAKVEMEKAEHEEEPAGERHGEHADVNASYAVKCGKSLKGSAVRVGMFSLFPRLKAASFQVLTGSGQVEKKVESSDESVIVP
jgi:hypothetical protein